MSVSLRHSVRTLTKWLKRFSSKAEIKSAPVTQINTGVSDGRPEISNIEARLRSLFSETSEQGTGALAQLQFLNLSHIREEVGARWPRVQRLVHLLTETTLYRHLGPNDFFFKCREDVYVIAFPHLAAAEAAAICKYIVDEISRHLFGQKNEEEDREKKEDTMSQLGALATSLLVDPQKLHEATSAQKLVEDIALNFADQNKYDVSALDRRVEKAISDADVFMSTLTEERSIEKVPTLIKELGSLIDKLRALELELLEPASTTDSSENPNISYHPIEWQGLKPGYDFDAPQQWRVIPSTMQEIKDRLSHTLNVAQERLKHLEHLAAQKSIPENDICWRSVPDLPISYAIDYLPVLETKRNVVAIYLSRIRFKAGEHPVVLNELPEIGDNPEVRAIASRLLVRAVVNQIAHSADEKSIRIVSIDDAIFGSAPYRRTFFEFITNIDRKIQKQIAIEVVLHADWAPLQVEQCLLQLQPFCRAIFLRLPNLNIDLTNTSMFTSKIRRLTSAVGIAPSIKSTEEREFISQLKKLVLQCEKIGLHSYLFEVPSLSIFMNSVGIGMTFISGAAILHATDHPFAAHSTSIEEIYSSFASNST